MVAVGRVWKGGPEEADSAEGGPGQLAIAPGSAGDVRVLEFEGQELFLEKGAYLASTPGIKVDSKFDELEVAMLGVASSRQGAAVCDIG